MGAALMALLPPPAVLRPAARADAPALARLADMAGEGLPLHQWRAMAAPGEDPWAVGAARAARDGGAFSWRNARVVAEGDRVLGSVVDYALPDAPEPAGADVPALLRPLCELEARARGTHYVNILAVAPAARRRGVGRRLLDDVAVRARGRPVTLIAASGNRGARAFYAARGFDEVARLRMGPGGPPGHDGHWILLRRG